MIAPVGAPIDSKPGTLMSLLDEWDLTRRFVSMISHDPAAVGRLEEYLAELEGKISKQLYLNRT